MYVLRLAFIGIFIVGNATCSLLALLNYDSSDITIDIDNKNPCNATRQCSDCRTSRLCIPVNDKFQQVALIACDKNPVTPYCDQDTGLCTSVAPNGCASKDFICPSASGTYPDPVSCTRYHICVDGYRITNVCPPNNVYDHVLGDCRLRRTVSDCVVVNCQGQEGKAFVYPKDDRIYGSCVTGRPYLIGRCKDYEKYDLGLRRCVRVCRGPGNQPSEECQKYVRCAETSRGKYQPVFQYCPCDKGFDEDTGVCTAEATCMQNVTDPCKLKPKVAKSSLAFFSEDEDQEDDSDSDSADDPVVSTLIVNNSENQNSDNSVSNGNDNANGNIVNGNGNDNNANNGNVGNVKPSRPGLRPFIINNSGNSDSHNEVSNGDDSVNGNIVNGNGNSNNANEGNVGNVKPSRPGLRPFIINNSGNSNSDSNVSNGNDSSNGNIVNGNDNDNNANNGNVGNAVVPKPGLRPLIINNSNNDNSNNNVSNGNDKNNGNIVNGNANGNNSNSGNVGN
ncbi:hypothetical protein KPH14_008776 [Odynerus spinipes]|uniref:Chitin-binding type-2 domain-containing protein n=1 Tax=Odynerus spinipes TaxID=1348599 RepID=A0AAD9R8A5_9HYME|nr:hypothetical protein KPH14_008776 [Odynerus spinipes]